MIKELVAGRHVQWLFSHGEDAMTLNVNCCAFAQGKKAFLTASGPGASFLSEC